MALRREISFQWRMFVPVVLIFWLIIICMAWWQVQRVGVLKRDIVYGQLRLISERLVDIYNMGDDSNAEPFLTFVNRYYEEAFDYDPMSIQVVNQNGITVLNMGNIETENLDIPANDEAHGVVRFKGDEIREFADSDEDIRYLYYVAKTNDNESVYVFLPYTKDFAKALSERTTLFWIIFFGIGLFATFLAYVSTHYLNRSVKLLRKFARSAANDPSFVGNSNIDFPHDELGDISRQILSIYNQRMAEIDRREREHKVAMHAIDEKNRIKRELNGNINHELKTPVGVIQGYIDTLVENPDMDAETRTRFLQKTHKNVHRLSALIADVTAITRLECGDKLVNTTDVDMHELVFSFAHFLHEGNVLQGKFIFEYDVPMDCVVLANESLLHSMLLNLVKNAVAYSQGTICRLECLRDDDDFFYFRFYDDGIGISPEHLPRLFERFYRINSGRSRDCGGTGLGLSIVEVTVKSFGGDITATNRYPSGLQFDFSLPKYKPAD